jgi:SAM-dependent methyltransferase
MQSNDNLPLSPSAERNKEPILEVLRRQLPANATVLEIASGTGQHVVHFASGLPSITWQPSERDGAACELIRLRIDQTAQPNVRAPVVIDVHRDPWTPAAEFDAVLCINMIHIAPWSATENLFRGAHQVLRTAGLGLLITYGPYMVNGRHTAPSNEAFDQSLRSQNPSWGVRDVGAVDEVATRYGFKRRELVRMPANNLTLTFIRD